ncbi:MAG: hypothetical protein L0Z07_08255 [Planctomycetes bacterium]|nr:hypothetical protein [Planctomycetota bacterium]
MPGWIEMFVGAVTNVEARVYAQHPKVSTGGHIVLRGRMRGPFCRHARTLAAEIVFRDLGPGPTALAEAVVPDPCTWSPDLPHYYEADIEAREGQRVVAEYHGMLGIRRLAVRGTSFVLDGRRWVVRGTRPAEVGDSDLSAWRRERLVMMAANPGDELCESASREGVCLIAELADDEASDETLLRLSRWPAVLMTVEPEVGLNHGAAAPRGLLAMRKLVAGEAPCPPGCSSVFVMGRDVTNTDRVSKRLTACGPVIAERLSGPYGSLAVARAACDALQRDMAIQWNLAGYVV